jgi:hypothetical protein
MQAFGKKGRKKQINGSGRSRGGRSLRRRLFGNRWGTNNNNNTIIPLDQPEAPTEYTHSSPVAPTWKAQKVQISSAAAVGAIDSPQPVLFHVTADATEGPSRRRSWSTVATEDESEDELAEEGEEEEESVLSRSGGNNHTPMGALLLL